MMNYAEMKNDTARKNATRATIMDILYPALVAEFGEENVAKIEFPITIMNLDEKECGDIGGNSIAVCTGQTTDKDGATVDVVAVVDCTVKAFNTVTNKAGRTTYAINFDDVLRAIAAGKTEREAKAAEKEAKSKKK